MTTTDAFGLAGKVCVVTGAASGVGQSVAVYLTIRVQWQRAKFHP